jgi:tetratricopeptide (TPR) repeat protein
MVRIFCSFLILIFISSCNESAEQKMYRANSWQQKAKYDKAIKIYSSIIRKNSRLQAPYYNRGLCYSALKKFPYALADFNKVMSLQKVGNFILTWNADSPLADDEAKLQIPFDDARYQRAQVLYAMDSIQNSYVEFEQLSIKNYRKSNCFIWLGALWLKMGANDSACKSFAYAKKFAINEYDTIEADRFISEHCSK